MSATPATNAQPNRPLQMYGAPKSVERRSSQSGLGRLPRLRRCQDRSTEKAHLQRRIIAAAKDLFHKQGVRATPVDDIVQASRVSRKEFYHSFRSKQSLAKEVVLAYLVEIESGRSRLYPTLASWNDLERLLATQVAFLKKFNMQRGCPLAIIGNELREKDDATRQALSLIFEALTNRMVGFFQRQKTEGHLCKSANEGQLADFCLAAIQGAMLMGKLRGDPELVESVFEEIITHVEHLRLGSYS